MGNYAIANRTTEENRKYKELLKEAYSRLDEAINEISYGSKITDCAGNKLNHLIIDELDSIICKLETLEDATLFKPININ